MSKPIGVSEAAFIGQVTRKEIYDAMEVGKLMWLDFGGHQVTTKRWLNSWRKTGGRV